MFYPWAGDKMAISYEAVRRVANSGALQFGSDQKLREKKTISAYSAINVN